MVKKELVDHFRIEGENKSFYLYLVSDHKWRNFQLHIVRHEFGSNQWVIMNYFELKELIDLLRKAEVQYWETLGVKATSTYKVIK